MSGAKEIGFSLKKITTEQFAIIEDAYTKGSEVLFITGIEFDIDREKQQVATYIEIRFTQNNAPFLLLETSVVFAVHDNAWETFVKSKEKKIVIPKGFLTHLAMIAVGTTRGVLHAKTENSAFNRFMVPTINVAERITADGIFPLVVDK
jgi:hypothetical protein